MNIPSLAIPKLGLASFRRRLLFRGAFLLLILATVALALMLLTEEKQRSYDNYRLGFKKTQSEIIAKLRHPSGQLALLNPGQPRTADGTLRPLVLPYAALDFDDQHKAQQAVETASCSAQYPDGSSLCVAIGNNPYAGGFIYLVGSYPGGNLVARERGAMNMELFHRARVTLTMRGQTTQWIAPFEDQTDPGSSTVRGRLTGFANIGPVLPLEAKPLKDFRGWLWQSGQCADDIHAEDDCLKRTFFSVRLPVEIFREALFQKPRPIWPPADLEQIGVRFEMLAPGDVAPLFDSNAAGAMPPLSLNDLAHTLSPGEVLQVGKEGLNGPPLLHLKGAEDRADVSSPWLERLIRKLPVNGHTAQIKESEIIRTAIGNYKVTLSGELRSLDRAISAVATRLSWFVAAMLGAIALAWLVIELGLIRRIAVLTRRAAAVSYNVQGQQAERNIGELDVSDLRGSDELGILAGSLADLLKRVKDDVRREHIRAQQERDMWHAVGHEIMSPLQSLMVLHPQPGDQSHRYVQRMQQAVRVLYGTASPSEALEAATLTLGTVDLNEFLMNVANNAHFAGLENVVYQETSAVVKVRADEFPLEDVVTHILRNADRFRDVGSPITITVQPGETTVTVAIHNRGKGIDPAQLNRIFEYGVTDDIAMSAAATEHRGQGLFVVKTYMAKMDGTVTANNSEDGVTFALTLQRAT